MSSQLPPFSLRIPENMLQKIKFIARENGRSANKEIEQIIKSYVAKFEAEHGEISIEANLR